MLLSKRIFLPILLLGAIGLSMAQEAENSIIAEDIWLSDFQEARSEAAHNGQYILMSFSGSDWCLPCMRLERDLFSTEAFAEFAKEHLVLLKLDFPARKKNSLSPDQVAHNEALAEKYNERGSFPLVVITDAEGAVKGYMEHPLISADAYLESISKIIQH